MVPPKHPSRMDAPPDRNGQREAGHVAISGSGGLSTYGGEKHALAAPGAPLLPKRALVLAQELLMRGVEAIKADS